MIPYGVGPPFTAEGPAADGDYVLAVSTLEPRKNFERLVEGFRRSGLDGLELRVVGAEGWGGVEVEGDRVQRLEGVDDEELARLYRGAVAVMYVSLYEGFGLPVLEAMASGTPVVAPAGPPYDEFAQGIAFEVDPLDVDSIAHGLQRAVDSGLAAGRRAAEQPTSRGSAPCSRTSTSTRSSPGEAARRRRRGRPRPPPHRRRDVRGGAPPRAGADRRRGAHRRDHAAARARPGRDRGLRACGEKPGRPHGVRSPTRAATAAPLARSLHLRRSAGLPRACRRHRPGPVVRAGPRPDGPARPVHVPNVRAPIGKESGSRNRHLRAHEARPRRALRDSRAEDRRHPARGRPDLPARTGRLRTCRRTRSSSAGSSLARIR